MAAARPSNPLALAVLVLLYERPMHPYEISTTLRERRKEDSIKLNYGSLYSVVATLQKGGLIEVLETVREGNRPERTIYAITEDGKTAMIDWLTELVSVPAKEYTRFEAALSLLGALRPDEAIRLLELRLTSLEMHRRAGEAVMAASPRIPRIFIIEFEFTTALLNAEITFVRDLIDDMRSERLTGIGFWRRMHELRATDLPPAKVNEILEEEFRGEISLDWDAP